MVKFNERNAPIVTLDEILKNDIVLLDCSMKDAGQEDFYWQMGEWRNPSDVEIEEIVQERIRTEIFMNKYLSPENIAFSEKLVDEFSRLPKIVSDKINYLFNSDYNLRREDIRQYDSQKEALQNLQDSLFRMSKNVKRKRITKTDAGILDNQDVYFLDMIKLINSSINLKKDSNIVHGKHRSKKWADSDTDEDTIALSYCLAMNNISCAILTGDTDYIRLMGVCTNLIGSEDFIEYNLEFRNKMRENGPRIYFRDKFDKSIVSSVDTRNSEFLDEFRIHSMPLEESIKIKHNVKDSWKNLYEIYSKNIPVE